MPNEGNNQQPSSKKKLIIFAVLVIIVIVAAAVWFMVKYPTSRPSETTTTTIQSVPEITSDSDLKKLEDEVKGIDIDDLSKDLDQNDKDVSEF